MHGVWLEGGKCCLFALVRAPRVQRLSQSDLSLKEEGNQGVEWERVLEALQHLDLSLHAPES